MVRVGQLRAWRGAGRSSAAPGYGGGETFLVLGSIPQVSQASQVWRVLLSTGVVSMFDSEFLDLESDELHT